MRRLALLLPLLALTSLPMGSTPATTAENENHCLTHATVTPTADGRGVRFEKGAVVRTPRFAPEPRHTQGEVVVIRALSFQYDADNNEATVRDTITVPPGTAVRWQWVAGFHTITDGVDGGSGGQLFDYLLDSAHPVFDTTLSTIGQLDYFCFAHEGFMHGVIKIQPTTGVDPAAGGRAVSFSRPPAPNPGRGPIGFAITVPRALRVEIDVVDASGRQVARVARGEYGAGEHAFAWNGRRADGSQARAGVYLVRLKAGGETTSKRFSLLR